MWLSSAVSARSKVSGTFEVAQETLIYYAHFVSRV